MVKKLFKYEFIYYIRTMGLFMAVVPVLGMMVRIFRLFDPKSIAATIAIASSGILCYLGALAVLVMTAIVGIMRFYKNMYSSEGYLTLTLPVTYRQHIFVKLVTLVTVELVALLSVVIGAAIALSGDVWYKVSMVMYNLFANFTINFAFVTEYIILALVSVVGAHLLHYACITIGQTAKKNRALLAVGVYFIYYTITQVIVTIALIIFAIAGASGAIDGLGVWMATHPDAAAHIVLIGAIAVSAALAFLYWFVTERVMKRKLNLE